MPSKKYVKQKFLRVEVAHSRRFVARIALISGKPRYLPTDGICTPSPKNGQCF